ncbi:hypothetical protein CKAH01_12614 [Colletotrichum kahawae]|uniref:Uncharacterized protein n=1 Tax=Colletotrichum kahawae TaxID=34407 RepID=A0AAE0DC66_COLKA|nr:hypothetical protein CKAH01_12614 [Colletotrichum kahawae]
MMDLKSMNDLINRRTQARSLFRTYSEANMMPNKPDSRHEYQEWSK